MEMNGLWMWRTDHQTTHLFKWPNNERRKTMRGLMTVCRLWWRWGGEGRRRGGDGGRNQKIPAGTHVMSEVIGNRAICKCKTAFVEGGVWVCECVSIETTGMNHQHPLDQWYSPSPPTPHPPYLMRESRSLYVGWMVRSSWTHTSLRRNVWK